MLHYQRRAGLSVAEEVTSFVEERLLPGLDIGADRFWQGCEDMLRRLAPENQRLLDERERLQKAIDAWLGARRGQDFDMKVWQSFLEDIGYLQPQGPDFTIETTGVDDEIARLAGPQLVVPVMNARFALNAANARWGSLYDAFYGTDALPGQATPGGYDPVRGAAVAARVAAFLDQALPLASGSHADVTGWVQSGERLFAQIGAQQISLSDPGAFVGTRQGDGQQSLLFRHNNLHIELIFDPSHPVGAASASGLRDVVLEAALTVIQDLEDSIAAVDAADKVAAWGNWLGLMKGDLCERFVKNGKEITRALAPDRSYMSPAGQPVTLRGRALLLVRNVGHLMKSDAVLLDDAPVPEGLLDALITVTAAMHDLGRRAGPVNSQSRSVIVVKPKLHGPQEAALAAQTFDMVEALLALPKGTVKLGLMDEERRTSASLKETIRALKSRIVFINTGFLDRTGDEYHTMMQAGPLLPKERMRETLWFAAYEQGNVDAGLAAGFAGRGQIGKGMWAKPDAMEAMLAQKGAQLRAGASTAWVPSPTAAVLHAIHYHEVNVPAVQAGLKGRAPLDPAQLLSPPLLTGRPEPAQIRHELDLNCQSVLGYVVRWIDQGIGCSKVPDLGDVALMEDRATLRISAQFLANWLLHGLFTAAELDDSLRRMALAVDRQNAGEPGYKPMAPGFDGAAFQAARALIFEARDQPSGYTEPLLHHWRRAVKAGSSPAFAGI